MSSLSTHSTPLLQSSANSFSLASTPRYRIHPVVVFSVLDNFPRRSESQSRAVGTLLGSIENGIIEVKSAFAVPYEEGDETVSQQHYNTIYRQ
jgi:translation initiation factor 3 subunit F